MRTITKTVKLFKFCELSEVGKDKAKMDMAIMGYSWADEALESIQELAKHFGGRVKNYSIDWFKSSCSSMSFDMPEDMTKTEIRKRLRDLGKYNRKTGRGLGECKLTGFCMDEDAIDGFRAAFKDGVTDLNELMQAAYETWLRAAQDDCAYQFSDETFSEMCEANNYEFTEDGSMS